MFDVMMHAEMGGAAYPLAALRSMLESAVLQEVRGVDLPETMAVLVRRAE